MWRLTTDRGRQVWEEPAAGGLPPAGTPDGDAARAVVAAVDTARSEYVTTRMAQAHAGDKVLRALAAAGLLGCPSTTKGADGGNDEIGEGGSGGDGYGVPRPALPLDASSAAGPDVDAALQRGVAYFSTLQLSDGHWAGDYGGPLFLMPGLIIVAYVSGTLLGDATTAEMVRYLSLHANDDGGYGLHIEGPSTVFGTALCYVSLRLLGMTADAPVAAAARGWLLAAGGAAGIPSWGKFWLALLGVYEWGGLNPLTPEMWLLPYGLPVHPGRYWIHCRAVYLPMSYLYGRRATYEGDALTAALREELYVQRYADISWPALRNHCSPTDTFIDRPVAQKALWAVLSAFEAVPFPGKAALRRRALDETLRHVRAEDANTHYIDIGPVNKTLNMAVEWFAHDLPSPPPRRGTSPPPPRVAAHAARLRDYLWLAEDGMKMQGYNGSQLWDTAFASQALVRAGLSGRSATLRSAHAYVEVSQVRADVPDREVFYRHPSKGAWPFSTVDHGWPIADCTAEGLKAALALAAAGAAPPPNAPGGLEPSRLRDAVDMLLSYHNPGSGGWATYELTRSYAWVEALNPSEVFGDIMIDYPYVECTSAAVTALLAFRDAPAAVVGPGAATYRAAEVAAAISSGVAFVVRSQRPDGSWYGSWGVCFTYAAFFAIDVLVAAGVVLPPSSSDAAAGGSDGGGDDGSGGRMSGGSGTYGASLRAGCAFLASVQRPDGAWGETYESCVTGTYVQAPAGQVVHTAWALGSLAKADWPDAGAVTAAASWLAAAQEPSGDWPQQRITGVFNKNCMITYANYRSIFPIWALAEYRHYMERRAGRGGVGQ